MRIRSVRDDDWERCAALDLSYETDTAWQMEEQRSDGIWAVRFTEVRLPRKQHIAPLVSKEERLKAWLCRDAFWMATERRKVLGYLGLGLEIDHTQARITDLGVAPDMRRQGVATALLQHAEHWCLRQGMQQLILECSPKAHPAISFAQANGFTICGFQDVYWPGQDVGLFFRKRIL